MFSFNPKEPKVSFSAEATELALQELNAHIGLDQPAVQSEFKEFVQAKRKKKSLPWWKIVGRNCTNIEALLKAIIGFSVSHFFALLVLLVELSSKFIWRVRIVFIPLFSYLAWKQWCYCNVHWNDTPPKGTTVPEFHGMLHTNLGILLTLAVIAFLIWFFYDTNEAEQYTMKWEQNPHTEKIISRFKKKPVEERESLSDLLDNMYVEKYEYSPMSDDYV